MSSGIDPTPGIGAAWQPCIQRRAHVRYALNGVYGTLIHNRAEQWCEYINISLGGCCVRLEKPFAPGALARVEMVLPVFGQILRTSGQTRWVNPQEKQVGIQFTKMPHESRDLLATLITCLINGITDDIFKERTPDVK